MKTVALRILSSKCNSFSTEISIKISSTWITDSQDCTKFAIKNGTQNLPEKRKNYVGGIKQASNRNKQKAYILGKVLSARYLEQRKFPAKFEISTNNKRKKKKKMQEEETEVLTEIDRLVALRTVGHDGNSDLALVGTTTEASNRIHSTAWSSAYWARTFCKVTRFSLVDWAYERVLTPVGRVCARTRNPC